ncbi:hypothetical protein SASPL_101912 [Salvia splendens]|uniref:DUF7356 domain-containing protein n=1 Tax=Salvia splendens TaxID=180675 RepID=A0A8X8YSL6_SALSN|nr:uncharacterized protein LOC121746676 [Salvia splendens]KAG6437005.1 hypothetical protein SASPL_101912 [Salvia splendens]
MDKNRSIAIVLVFLFLSTTCNASLVFHLRKLIASEGNNAPADSQVSPIANDSNTNTSSINTENPQLDKPKESEKPELEKPEESQAGNQTNSDSTLPVHPEESKKPDNGTKSLGAPSPPEGEKKGNEVVGGNEKVNVSMPKPDDNVSCDGSVSNCREQTMLACIKMSKDGGLDSVFLVATNEGENTLKVNIKLPNSVQYIVSDVEVPKHTSKKINISSVVGKSNKLIVSSGGSQCNLVLVQSASIDKIMQQLSFYSKQVTPIYAVYASFLITLLLGGTWACCRFRKRNQQDVVTYQELEMGLPESTANVDSSEGWDQDWDDDWDEDVEVKSPSGHQVRGVSADGLTSRSPKRDGWENGWDD